MSIIYSARNLLFLSCMLSFCTLTACTPTLTPEEETEASTATTNWLDQKFGVVSDPEFNVYAAQLMTRLTDAAHSIRLHSSEAKRAQDWNWQLFLLNVPQTNAFSVGNGTIFVTKGLFWRLETEAQLASVISHEMAHQILGHTRDALIESRDYGVSPAFYFSLDKEMEADRLGLMILKQARYDVNQANDAFTIVYRNQSKGIAEGDDKVRARWVEERASYLERLLFSMQDGSAGIDNRREFNKVKESMARKVGL